MPFEIRKLDWLFSFSSRLRPGLKLYLETISSIAFIYGYTFVKHDENFPKCLPHSVILNPVGHMKGWK